MDQSADNYDENAEYDNGTCCYIGELSTDILPALCSDDIASLNILSSSIYNLNYEVLNFELSNSTGQFDLDEGEYDMKKNLIFWLFALLLLTACGSSEATQQTGDTAQASQITVYKSPT